MSNMSYVRFENTDNDLSDCLEKLEDLANGDGEPLSRSELQAAASLASKCAAIVQLLASHSDIDITDLDGDLNSLDFDNLLAQVNGSPVSEDAED